MDTAWIIAIATSVLALTFFVAWLMARSRKADKAPAQLQEEDALRSAQTKAEAAAKVQEELRAKLDKTKDELKRAKKKAYEAEQNAKSKPPEQEVQQAERLQLEKDLADALSEKKKAQAQAAGLSKQLGSAKQDIQRLEKTLAEKPQVPAKKAAPGKDEDKEADESRAQLQAKDAEIKELKAERKKLKGKLEAARKKERNDNQVYRVTKSKLELAMERIDGLEQQLNRSKAPAEKSAG